MIGRRELLAGSLGAVVFMAADEGQACTVVATRRTKRFSHNECVRQIRSFVEFLNEAHKISEGSFRARVDQLNIDVGEGAQIEILGDTSASDSQDAFFRNYLVSEGKVDEMPARNTETNLIRQVKFWALYQFTVERKRYFLAQDDSCTGPTDAGFYPWKTSYIGTFANNRLRTVEAFPQWDLDS